MDATTLHDRAGARLRATRQRYTSGRRALVRQLDDLHGPATIQELLDRGSDSSSSSLYRNLAILEQCDVVHRVAVDDVMRWELHEDLTEHHHHLVCRVCGRVADVTVSDEVEQALVAAAEDANSRSDFTITAHNLEFTGTCDDCVPEAGGQSG